MKILEKASVIDPNEENNTTVSTEEEEIKVEPVYLGPLDQSVFDKTSQSTTDDFEDIVSQEDDIQQLNFVVKMGTKQLLDALHAAASAAGYAKYESIYLIYNPENPEHAFGIVGGNEKNLIFINAKGRIDRSKTMAAIGINPKKFISMIQNFTDVACELNIDTEKGSIEVKDSNIKYSISKSSLETSWVTKVIAEDFTGFVKADVDEFNPVMFSLDNDALKDIALMARSAFGELLLGNNDRIFLAANEELITMLKVTTSTFATVRKKTTVEFTGEDKTLLLQIPSDQVKYLLSPFVNSVLADNKFTVHKSHYIVEKDDGSGFCAFTRGVDVRNPAQTLKLLMGNATKLANITVAYQDIKTIISSVLAIVEDTGLSASIGISLQNEGKGNLRVKHTTSTASVNTRCDVNYEVYDNDGKPHNNIQGAVLNINSMSFKRFGDSINFIQALTESQKEIAKDDFDVRIYKGIAFERNGGQEVLDFITMGTSMYNVAISTSNEVLNAEGITLPEPKLITQGV